MQPKSTSHVIQGMQKDTSKSKLSNKFAFDAKNIRITAIDDNSLLSVTNEKGNKYTAKIQGAFLGHCVLKDSIVVFSSYIDKNGKKQDCITLYDYSLTPTELVETDLNFSSYSSIEALGVYENETVYKVYWVDGVNPPRVINVRAPEEIRKKWTSSSFDFVPELTLQESISVEHTNASSLFAPGVIQYAFSYHNKYGQESNIFDVTPLCYIAHAERGASPEEIVKDTSFKITIDNVDTNFEYIRIYSIHRTSLDAIPTVKKIIDLPISSKVSTYIDNGTLGETIDPTQLLYIGGEDIIAGTITQKDNTLFLGNIKLTKLSIPQDIKNSIRDTILTPQRRYLNINTEKELFYPSDSTIVNEDSYYRAGEHYRVGIQFQHKSGKWSEPIYITDYTIGLNQRPTISYGKLSVPSFSCYIYENISSKLISYGYKKMRGLVVFPEKHESKVLAQGMLCPTVFNTKNRKENSPYSQSSWFLRPYLIDTINDDYFENTNSGTGLTYEDNLKEINKGAVIEFRHRKPLITGANRGSEIQNNTEYLIDQSVLNFYSPDINDDFVSNYLDKNIQMRIVGLINFTSNYGDIDIQTKTPPRSITAKGFIHKTIDNLSSGKSGLISGLYYSDDLLYMVYPWHRSGSLNDDNISIANSNNKTQSAVLEKKKISNIKFSKYNTWIPYNKIWNSFGGNSKNSLANGISKIEYFNSNQVSLLKLKSNIEEESLNYFGNIDTLVSNENNYPIYYGTAWADKDLLESEVEGTEPVRIKYKTTPHLVFKLNNAVSGHEVVLPTINNLNSVNGDRIEITEEFNPEYIGEEVKYRTFIDTLSIDFPSDAEEGDLWLKEEKVWYNFYPDTPPNPSEVNSPFIILRLLKYNGKSWEDHTKGIYQDKKNKVHYLENPYEASLYYFNGRTEVGGDVGNNDYVYAFTWKFEKRVNITPPSTEIITVTQDSIETTAEYPYLYLAELYIDSDYFQNAFGGITEEAIRNNLWLPASQSVPISSNTIVYEYGDTRYQRYDCLKTYAFTPEDENQVIEIASFMCETRVNMLGRYDKNIGNLSNLNADPTNFNLFNPVYSQKDNFFNYRILNSDRYKLDKFTNTITWSKEKHLGEDVDTWTNITMANTLDLDGTKGKVNKLITFKDQIFAFQDKGISRILFNSRVQIPVSDGVPIEISNSMKVDGSIYISDIIGCQNKNSIVTTPSGVYFLDSETSSIYLLADGITNLSNNKGFSVWTKEVARDSSFKTFYDKNNQDVYFTTENYCLGYSEKLEQFVSFYDYNDVDLMFNLYNEFYSVKSGGIYRHHTGEYNMFYGEYKPYSITIISNDNPYTDKIFNTVEYRADLISKEEGYRCESPFDTLEVWNEYQKGESSLVFNKYAPSSLKKKFRMWRANIPRDCKNKLDRMRNPWLYIKLSNNNNLLGGRMELHDIMVHYFE